MDRYVHFKKVSAQDVGQILGRVSITEDDLLGLVERGYVDPATGYFLRKIVKRLGEISEILEPLEYHTEKVEWCDGY